MRKSTGREKQKAKKARTNGTLTRKIKHQLSSLKNRIKSTRKTPAKKTAANSKAEKPKLKEDKILTAQTAVGVIDEQQKVELSKFTPPPETQINPGEFRLPPRYYDDRITLLARDPWWLHTYWDISETRIEKVISGISEYERQGLRWIIRVYDLTGARNPERARPKTFFDVDVRFEANSWYIQVYSPERSWCVEIGMINGNGKFFMVARSNVFKAPHFGISEIIDEEWTFGDEDQYYKVFGAYELGQSSVERKRGLEEILKQQISSGAFSGGISSLFPLESGESRQRRFFLEVWTEVILYGRTYADATVTVSGKKVPLKNDGTFSLRYALEEGDYEFKVEAFSADGKDRRKVTPAVKRYSK